MKTVNDNTSNERKKELFNQLFALLRRLEETPNELGPNLHELVAAIENSMTYLLEKSES